MIYIKNDSLIYLFFSLSLFHNIFYSILQPTCSTVSIHIRAVNRFKNPNRFFTGFLTSNRFFKPVFFSGSVITKRCLRSAKILAFYAMHVHIYVCVFKCISDQAAVN